MTGDCHVQFGERLEGKFLWPTQLDFKIHIKKVEGFSKTRFLKELKHLAKSIVTHDAKKFKNQHPEYSADPISEIKRSLAILKNESHWKERYQEFIDTMVYDTTTVKSYESAIENLEHISERVIDSLA